jgi:nucleotide-binding universal stress UspA family protein
MFTNILVGVDGRPGGRDAIALARLLASPDATITLANVYGSGWLLPRCIEVTAALQRDESERMLAAQRSAAGVDAQIVCAWHSTPGRGLHELAQARDSDLIVVGSSRRALLGRALLGDDTRASLNGAPCAIAVAPAGYAQQPRLFTEIGVGYNGEPESEHALAVARELADEHGARLSAFEAVSIPAIALSAGPAPVDEWMQDLLDDARRRVSALEDVEPHAVYGQASEELAMFSASVDLLVVGSRGYGPLGRLVHGSTSRDLARVARSPLLVLPRATGTAADRGVQAASTASVTRES